MADRVHEGDGRTRNPGVRRERTDVSLRGILAVMAVALVIAALIHTAVWGFFRDYRDYQARVKESSFPLARRPPSGLPPEPRLEQLDRLADVESANVYKRLAGKEEALRRYGETEETGFVHVPIDRAMDMLAGKLPARAAPAASQQRRSGGLVDAGEPNSGRLFRKGAR